MKKRPTDNGPFKEFEFGDWIFGEWTDFEECMKDRNSAHRQNFRKHMRNAVKEQLMAVREVIDGVIEELDTHNNEPNKA
jgi:hypothetical protein